MSRLMAIPVIIAALNSAQIIQAELLLPNCTTSPPQCGLVLLQSGAKSIRATSLLAASRTHSKGELAVHRESNASSAMIRKHRQPKVVSIGLIGSDATFQQRSREVVFSHMRYPSHVHTSTFVGMLEDASQRTNVTSFLHSKDTDSNWINWALALLLTMAVLGFALRALVLLLAVDGGGEALASDVDDFKGNQWWTNCFCCCSLALNIIVFLMTIQFIHLLNSDIQKHPQKVTFGEDGNRTTEIRSEISSPGGHAFEASVGVALTIVVGCIFVLGRRYSAGLKVRLSLLAQFWMRGATLSLVVALVIEIVGTYLLRLGSGMLGGGMQKDGNLNNFLLMLIVGLAEEGAKVVAFTCSLFTVPPAPGEPVITCWCRPVLVEEPRILMLSGMAIGYGFMAVENAGYLTSVVSTPPTQYATPSDPDPTQVGGTTLEVISILTIFTRIVLNIHPWLAGMSAGRAAKVLYNKTGGPTSLGACGILVCMIPSALIHALYDFLLTMDMPAWVILAPLVFWAFSRHYFSVLWDFFEEPDEQSLAQDQPNSSSPPAQDTLQNTAQPTF